MYKIQFIFVLILLANMTLLFNYVFGKKLSECIFILFQYFGTSQLSTDYFRNITGKRLFRFNEELCFINIFKLFKVGGGW